ncbi:hypothetical protein AHF37_10236, partial [Paragonimus kellicotti]
NPTVDFPPPEESAEDKDAKHQSASAVSASLNTSTPNVVTKSNSSSSSKPMRLELAQEQMFVLDDPLTVYVWIYEPPPGLFNWLAGSALLVGVILCCLFPIWPVQLRTGAYYLTLCASGLFGLLLALAVVRLGFFPRMIEKRKKRKNAGDISFNEDAWKPTAEELEVTRYLYKKLPSKDGRLSGMMVRTFNPVEAIDLLLESPWAKIPPGSVNSKNAKPRLFASQAMAVAYMDILLQKQVFQRALCVKKKSVSKPREEPKVTKVKSKKTANETKAKEPVSETPLSADQQVIFYDVGL